MKIKLKNLSFLLIFVAASLWGVMGIFVRRFNALGFGSMQIVFIRAFFTVALLLPIISVFKPGHLKMKLKDIWCFIGTGILSIVFFTYFYFTTISYSSLSFAAVMMYTAPFFMVFFAAILFKEKITLNKLVACFLAFLGCVLVSGILRGFGGIKPHSVLTGVASGVFYALYTVFSRYALNRGYNSLTITFYTFFFALLGSMIFIDIPATFSILIADYSTVILSVVIAVICTILPYFFYTYGLLCTQSGVALIIASIEPIVATIVGFLLFNEKPTFESLLGVVLVFLSVIILNYKKK